MRLFLLIILFAPMDIIKAQATDGNWNKWSAWTHCNRTCGGGYRKKFRRCDNPPPYNGGLECVTGQKRSYYEEQTEQCNIQICIVTCKDKESKDVCEGWKGATLCAKTSPHHRHMIQFCKETCGFCGNWESWSAYSACSETCGDNGKRIRTRNCNNTESSPRTKYCLTKDKDMDTFEKEDADCTSAMKECPVNGTWGSWSYWSVDCCKNRKAVAMRGRYCDNPAPKGGGLNCTAADGNRKHYEEERRNCIEDKCRVDGNWNNWSNWTRCSCNRNNSQTRYRHCNNPIPQHGGLECLINNRERQKKQEQKQPCVNESCITYERKEDDMALSAHIIGAIVAGGVVLLLLIIVIAIYIRRRKTRSSKGNTLPPWINDTEFQGDNENTYSEVVNTKAQSYPEDEELYADVPTKPMLPNSTKENDLVYADVGKGGGRIGYRLKPTQSNYAEVKTEGTYYPPCNTSYDPPVYTLPSKDYFTKQRVANDEEISFANSNGDYYDTTQNI